MRNRKLETLVVTSEQLLILICSVICARIGLSSGCTIGVIAGTIEAIIFMIELLNMVMILVGGILKWHSVDKELKDYDEFCKNAVEQQMETVKNVFSK